MTNSNEVGERREAPLRTPSLLGAEDVRNITAELNVLPADVFALYIRTKNFHWLSAVLALLGGHGASVKRKTKAATAGPRRKMSAAGRKRIAAAQRARWAKIRAGKK
jgi:hypothetical protein